MNILHACYYHTLYLSILFFLFNFLSFTHLIGKAEKPSELDKVRFNSNSAQNLTDQI